MFKSWSKFSVVEIEGGDVNSFLFTVYTYWFLFIYILLTVNVPWKSVEERLSLLMLLRVGRTFRRYGLGKVFRSLGLCPPRGLSDPRPSSFVS